jgi:hypothetical protein
MYGGEEAGKAFGVANHTHALGHDVECTCRKRTLCIEQRISEVGKRFVWWARGGAEELERHKQAVRGWRGIYCHGNAAIGYGGGLEVSKFGVAGAFEFEHPDHVAEKEFLDDEECELLGQTSIGDQGCDQDMTEVGELSFCAWAGDEASHDTFCAVGNS